MKKRLMVYFLLTIFLLFNIPLAFGMTKQSSKSLIYEYIVPEVEKNAEYKKQIQEIMNELPTGDYDYIYEVEYGPIKEVTIEGFLANQPRNGTKFPGGGGFYCSTSGGAKYSVSVSFPEPFDMVTVSAELGYVSNSVSGVYIEAPNTTDYWKAYGEKDFEVQPIIVWKIHRYTGKKSKHVSYHSTTHLRSRYYCVKA
ncbi:MAG: hypothetical protein GX892_01685 [Thermoanaerobacteraceae bacterium]|uniref:hypothetical protein n=1 Tax=Tepidanaerobacter sp. GT38 TaxID=2722793 RepID=UPI00178E5031|nr:hypothetical protein [Tepidanaerobacter sp. GT38]MCG1013284.1 hypothetical protein [Tepidanaerobacter sp. GT38]NLZ51856.1 hypothetical protein [Thermoanaerobacteraceae bacterium]